MIHYLQPYRSDKDLPRAFNEACQHVPESDWICILDHDCLFLLPDQKAQIEEIVASNPDFELAGCMTNRLNIKEQVVPEAFEDDQISFHIWLAKHKQTSNYGQYKYTDGQIGGLFMLFRKSDFTRVGGFPDLPPQFRYKADVMFSQLFKKKAILTGVYLFHLYRWNSPDPTKDVKHLLP